jgi:hypothetical protein
MNAGLFGLSGNWPDLRYSVALKDWSGLPKPEA